MALIATEMTDSINQASRDYKPEIDWLRALAVLCVVGFHFEIPGFRGGFVGVDVFFVISGFLIGGIVQNALAAGTFSFASFYERRIRRLLPALYAMLAVVTLAGAFILYGSERGEFFRSILAVATFTSNILFWSESGYFDRASSEKPLLHTWSLGIEEQFYILLPLVLWAAWRWFGMRGLKLSVVALALLSFAISSWLAQRHGAAAFFLIHSRAWELLLGVMLVGAPTIRGGIAGHAARIAATVMLVAAVVSYPSNIAFPGVNALLPCLAAVLFILGGRLPMRVPPVELLGRMSYSIYLWHWPLYTLTQMRSLSMTLSAGEKAALIAALFVVSYLSYRFIEEPGRRTAISRKAVFTSALASTAVLLAVAAVGTLRSTAVDVASGNGLTPAEIEFARPCFNQDWTESNHAACFVNPSAKPVALLWGDSFSNHYMPGLIEAIDPRLQLMQGGAAACFPTFANPMKQQPFCDALAARVRQFLKASPPRVLIMSANWLAYTLPIGEAAMLASLKETIAAAGVPVVVIGPSIQFKRWLPDILTRAARRGSEPDSNEVLVEGLFDLDARMRRELSGIPGVSYVSPLTTLCPDRKCPLTIAGVPLTWDHAHLTATGSRAAGVILAPAIAEAAGISGR